MRSFTSEVIQTSLTSEGMAGVITCPADFCINAGQYLKLADPLDGLTPLAHTAFAAAPVKKGLVQLAAPLPESFLPGTILAVRGPVGKGFAPPGRAAHYCLVSLSGAVQRLMGLAQGVLSQPGTSLALFLPQPEQARDLPPAMELLPLEELPAMLGWADYFAIDMTLEGLATLRARLGLTAGALLPCPAQALVVTSMPCTGRARCGVCAIPGRKAASLLACEDGPVFDLNALEW